MDASVGKSREHGRHPSSVQQGKKPFDFNKTRITPVWGKKSFWEVCWFSRSKKEMQLEVSKQGVARRKRHLSVVLPTPILTIGAQAPVEYYLGSFLNLEFRLLYFTFFVETCFQMRSTTITVIGSLTLDKPLTATLQIPTSTPRPF